MPRFLAPITVAQEYVTDNETISGSETILGATSGKDSYWTSVNATSGISADYGSFINNVSATSFYGDGTHLTGVVYEGDARLTNSRSPSGDAGGDLGSTYPNPKVVGLQGNTISTQTPSIGQMLQWTGTSWTPASIPTGGSGGGGVMYYLNYSTFAQSPVSGLPSNSSTRQLGRTANSQLSSITSGTLSQTTYDLVAGFVTDVLDPQITSIPAGLWDFNIWASGNATQSSQTILKIVTYTYSGSTITPLASSDDISMYDPTVVAQYIGNVTVPQTTILSSTRIYVELKAKATTNNRTVTFSFGGNTPSHSHTTIPSVAGSGLVKTINGVYQTPASLLVDSDVASNAAISQTKISGLTAALDGKFDKTGGTISDGLTANSGNFGTILSGGVDIGTLFVPTSNSTQVIVFSSAGSYIWNKPANAKSVYVMLIGGGGGGGGGARYTSTSACAGGGGGGGGGFWEGFFDANSLSASVAVSVGSGGNGGSGAVAIGAGNPGSSGGISKFDNYIQVTNGGNGLGGNITTAGAGAGGTYNGNAGGGGGFGASGAGGSQTNRGGAGGGGGGGVSLTPAAFNGGLGGFGAAGLVAAGAIGLGSSSASGGNGGNGSSTGLLISSSSSGGSGGGASTFATGSGGNGGNGGGFGTGGGGGGATIGSGTGGTGGNGASGLVIVITYF